MLFYEEQMIHMKIIIIVSVKIHFWSNAKYSSFITFSCVLILLTDVFIKQEQWGVIVYGHKATLSERTVGSVGGSWTTFPISASDNGPLTSLHVHESRRDTVGGADWVRIRRLIWEGPF